MVTLGSKRIHIVFMDSRGGDLQSRVNRLNTSKEYIEIDERKGASLADLIHLAHNYLPKHPFDVIYIAGGVNDITSKNDYTKQISYEWGNGPHLMDHLIYTVREADSSFKKDFPASSIVFCPLVGSDLLRVVNAHPTTLENQITVNDAVWDFNSEIYKINKERATFNPPLQHCVHRYCKGKRHDYYHHLQDGIHLSESLKEKWASQFVAAIAHN